MRVVQFLWKMSLADGGVVRAVLDLCPLLAAPGPAGPGLDVDLLTCVDDDAPAAWKTGAGAAGVPRVVRMDVPARGKTLSASALRTAEACIRGADVVHIHGMFLSCNTQIARLCAQTGTPYVWSPHGMLDDWSMSQKSLKKRVFMALIGTPLLNRSAAVHCTADEELRQAGRWFKAGKGVVVPLPFDTSPFNPGPGPALAERTFAIDRSLGPVILYLGRLHHKKGAHTLIEACAALNQRGVACQVLMAGAVGKGDEAYLSRLEDLARRPGAAGRVRMLGMVSGEPKASLYQAADVFCLPSSQENFGYVVAEAMAAATPVVTTRQVALWPSIQECKGGVVCADNALETTIAGLVPVLGDLAEAKEMGRRARAWTAREFDSPRVAARFAELYARAASSRVKGPVRA